MIDIAVLMNDQSLITFLFTLAVVFGALELAGKSTGAFKNRVVNGIIGFAFAYFASTYTPLKETLWAYLPNVTWFFIVMFFIAFSLELFGVRRGQGKGESIVVGGFILLLLMSCGWMILDQYPMEFPLIGGGRNLIFLIGVLFITSMFWAALKGEG